MERRPGSCALCNATFENESSDSDCKMCGSWTCPWCTLVNQQTASECEACGTERSAPTTSPGAAHIFPTVRPSEANDSSMTCGAIVMSDQNTVEPLAGSIKRGWNNLPVLSATCAQVNSMGVAGLRDKIGSHGLLVYPGGSAPDWARQMGRSGGSLLKTLVAQGLGYLGVCAGAYYGAQSTGDGELSLLPAIHDEDWERGFGICKLRIRESARQDFPDLPTEIECQYNQGPTFSRRQPPNVKVLYEFAPGGRHYNGSPGECPTNAVGCPAIVYGEHGRGRVVLVSPHPEAHAELGFLYGALAKWATGGNAGSAASEGRRSLRDELRHREATEDRCCNGHPLVARQLSLGPWFVASCDSCGDQIPQGTQGHRCEECNYDKCGKCVSVAGLGC